MRWASLRPWGRTLPDDRLFFDAMAEAAAGSGRIVVIGHGRGESREADHSMADPSHMTVPQLAQSARDALFAACLE